MRGVVKVRRPGPSPCPLPGGERVVWERRLLLSGLNGCGFLAEHLDRLEALLVVREHRVGHFSRRPGAGQPLRVELQGRLALTEALQDERGPGRQVLKRLGERKTSLE